MILEYDGKKPDTDKALYIADNAVIIGDVILEEGVTIWFGAVLRGDAGPIRVGRNTNIQDNCVVHCELGNTTTIGENVVVGHGAIIHSCTIGDNCMIGMGSIIQNDAVIADDSLVGAGALVTERKMFPKRALLLGSPAKYVKPVTDKQLQMIRDGAQEYLDFAEKYNNIK